MFMTLAVVDSDVLPSEVMDLLNLPVVEPVCIGRAGPIPIVDPSQNFGLPPHVLDADRNAATVLNQTHHYILDSSVIVRDLSLFHHYVNRRYGQPFSPELRDQMERAIIGLDLNTMTLKTLDRKRSEFTSSLGSIEESHQLSSIKSLEFRVLELRNDLFLSKLRLENLLTMEGLPEDLSSCLVLENGKPRFRPPTELEIYDVTQLRGRSPSEIEAEGELSEQEALTLLNDQNHISARAFFNRMGEIQDTFINKLQVNEISREYLNPLIIESLEKRHIYDKMKNTHEIPQLDLNNVTINGIPFHFGVFSCGGLYPPLQRFSEGPLSSLRSGIPVFPNPRDVKISVSDPRTGLTDKFESPRVTLDAEPLSGILAEVSCLFRMAWKFVPRGG